MRQIVPLSSSLISKEPSFATAIPTGRPQTASSEMTKPVRKILICPSGPAILEAQADDFESRGMRTIPRTVQCHKSIATILGRKLRAAVKGDTEWCGMRLDEYIR